MLIRAAALGLALVLNVVLARTLGPVEYGAYAYSLSLVNVVSVVGVLGLDRLLVRNLAAYSAQADWGHVRGFARWAAFVTTALLILTVVVALGLWLVFAPALPPLWRTALVAIIVITPALVLVRLAQSLLQGLQHPVASQVLEIIWQGVAIVLIGTAPYWMAAAQVNATLAVWTRSIAQGCAVVAAGLLIYRIQSRQIAPALPRYQSRIWLRSALYLLAAGVLTMLYAQLDILMLGWLTDEAQVSVYAAASKGALLVGLVLPSANLVLAPRFTGLLVTGDLAGLQRWVTLSARLILLATTPLCLLMIFAGRWFLSFFGPTFVNGHTTLIILSIGQWISVAMGSVSLLLVLAGYEREVVLGLAISVVISAVGNWLLIPRMGAEGAAITTTISTVIWNAILYYFVRRRLGLAPSILAGRQIQGEYIPDPHNSA